MNRATTPPKPGRGFELEQFEPRVLLSASLLQAALVEAGLSASGSHDAGARWAEHAGPADHAQAGGGGDDLFAEMRGVALPPPAQHFGPVGTLPATPGGGGVKDSASAATTVGGNVAIEFGSATKAGGGGGGFGSTLSSILPAVATQNGGTLVLNPAVIPGAASITFDIENAGAGLVTVTVPEANETATYSNVTEIDLPSPGATNTTVQLAPDVPQTVAIDSGTGTNTYVLGAGPATVQGEGGSDTITGGTGAISVTAGSGPTAFTPGAADNTLTGNGVSTAISLGGLSTFFLSNTQFGHGSFTDSISGVTSATLNPTTNASVTIADFSGQAIINGQGDTAATIEFSGSATVAGNGVQLSNGGFVLLSGAPSVILEGGPNSSFTVQSWAGAGAVNLVGSGGGDTYTIDLQPSASTAVVVTGSGPGGSDQVVVNGSASGGVINLAASTVTLGAESVVFAGVDGLQVNSGAGVNVLNINAPSIPAALDDAQGTNTVNVRSLTHALTIAAGDDTINVGGLAPAGGGTLAGFAAPLTINGGNSVNIDDSGGPAGTVGQLNGGLLTGLGLGGPLTVVGAANLTLSLDPGGNNFTILDTAPGTITTLNAGSGHDTVNLVADSGPTTVNGTGGDDTINVQTIGAATTIQTGPGANAITVGASDPALAGSLDGIDAPLTVVGSGNDTLNVDDAGSVSSQVGLLTSTALSGLGMAGLDYSGLGTLNIYTGSGGAAFTIASTAGSTTTTLLTGVNGGAINVQSTSSPTFVRTGTGSNTINIGAPAPAGGESLASIQGPLTVTGTGLDSLNVDDSGDMAAQSAALAAGSLTGLGMAGLAYSGIFRLNLNLDGAGTSLYLEGSSTAFTTINFGGGANEVAVGDNASLTPAILTAGIAPDTGSTLDGLAGVFSFTGGVNNSLNLDDTGATTPRNLEMDASDLKLYTTDPSAPYLTINDPGFTSVNLSLGSGADTVLINETFTLAPPANSVSPPSAIVINGDEGNDNFAVFDTQAVMTINGGSGDDHTYVFGNSRQLYLNGDPGNDNFYGFASIVAGATAEVNYGFRQNGAVNVNGGAGESNLFVFGTVSDDTFQVDGANVTGSGLDFQTGGLQTLQVAGLNGNDTYYVNSVAIPTTLSGGGNLPVFPAGIPDPDMIQAEPAGSFNETWHIGSPSAGAAGSLAGIKAPVTIEGVAGETNTVSIDDTADLAGQSFTLTSTTLTGGPMGSAGSIIYDDTITSLDFDLGAGDTTVTVNGTGTGLESSANGQTTYTGRTTIDGGNGNDTFIVNTDDPATGLPDLLSPLAINGGGNTFAGDQLTVNGAAAGTDFNITGFAVAGAGAPVSYENIESLTVNGGAGPNGFVIDGDSVPTFVNGGAGADSFTVNASGAALVLHAGADPGTVDVVGNNAPLSVFGDAGGLTLAVNASNGPVTVLGGAGANTFTVADSIAAPVTIQSGSNPVNTLTVNGTSGDESINMTGTVVEGSAAPVNYSGLSSLTVNGGNGDDTFILAGVSVAATVNGGSGNDVFDARSLGAGATLNPGGGVNIINVGSSAPFPQGLLTQIQANLTVNSGPLDTLNIGGSADPIPQTGTLTAATVSGLGMSGLITYRQLANLNLSLGPGGNSFTIAGSSAASTVLNSGAGNDTIYVQSITGPATVNTGAGFNDVIVGNPSSGGGQVSGITGLLTVNGNGSDTMTVDDSGTTAARAGTLTANSLTGLGMGSPVAPVMTYEVQFSTNLLTWTDLATVASANPQVAWTDSNVAGAMGFYRVVQLMAAGPNLPLNSVLSFPDGRVQLAWTGLAVSGTAPAFTGGIQYEGLRLLNLNLGAGGDNFTIASTNPSTITTVTGGAGNDVINVQTISSATALQTGPGANVIDVGSSAPDLGGVLDGIQGELTVIGGGADTLNVDDTGSPAARTGTLTRSTLTGLGMVSPVPASVTYQVQFSTDLTDWTTVGAVVSSSAQVTWTDPLARPAMGFYQVVEVGPLGDGPSITPALSMAAGQAVLTWSADATARLGGIQYSGLRSLILNLGSGGDSLTIASTNPGTLTSIHIAANGSLHFPATPPATEIKPATSNEALSLRSLQSLDATLNLVLFPPGAPANLDRLTTQSGPTPSIWTAPDDA